MNEDWKTQEIRDAEAALEEALANAERVGARADEMSRELSESKLSEEQTERIEQFVRRGQAPEGIVELQRRIDEGELSWDDVAEGRALQDEGVQSAFASGVPNMQQAKEMIDEGHEIDEIIENDPNRPPE
ncbi:MULTISPECIES: hypothetical protein [unclassified Actinopolyspora]|uniref:hypothetical protein n=1 Tax=unclassified Actinopolyspora TaxID=2639451 RepID=UPI0013F61854|nr:hypothetical protein [Actinopolyspora sp. BKK2]NHE75632.1 hypothetical protein [Actinopolyspora sp. BKK1]